MKLKLVFYEPLCAEEKDFADHNLVEASYSYTIKILYSPTLYP